MESRLIVESRRFRLMSSHPMAFSGNIVRTLERVPLYWRYGRGKFKWFVYSISQIARFHRHQVKRTLFNLFLIILLGRFESRIDLTLQ